MKVCRNVKKLSIFLVLIYLFWGYCLTAAALRCGNQIINLGDTPAKVKQYCGVPMRDSVIKRKSKANKNHHNEQQKIWTYNFGSSDFLYVLTFRNNKLNKIETHGYGY